MKNITREQWLEKSLKHLSPMFSKPLPNNIKVSCGFPSRKGTSNKSRSIGECFSPKSSTKGKIEIFISPVLDESNRVLDVLLHEVCHAVDIEATSAHGPSFRKLALSVGLTGKMTATVASPELIKRLNDIIKKIGKYPHAALNVAGRVHKKDGTRMLKLECDDCGYVVRTTKKWVDEGMPTCVCGCKFELKRK